MGRPAITIPKGTKFGRLCVLRQVPNTTPGIEYRCRCKCGTKVVIKAYNLRNGSTESCGCLHKEKQASQDGLSKRYPSEYYTWKSMIARCYKPKHKAWDRYGGRGIKVCKRWRGAEGFKHFLKDMGLRPGKKQLDRRDNNKGYSPGNCRWVTSKVNNNNRCNSRPPLTFDGKTYRLRKWSRLTGLSVETICDRISRGWSVRRALTTVPQRKTS